MQKGHHLQFKCQGCQKPLFFSLFELDAAPLNCICGKVYALNDPILKRQLALFEGLCQQIHAAKEILGNTAVGIDIGEHHVKIPYKLLLTRLTSSLNLKIGNEEIAIAFRIEPIQDLEQRAT